MLSSGEKDWIRCLAITESFLFFIDFLLTSSNSNLATLGEIEQPYEDTNVELDVLSGLVIYSRAFSTLE